MRAIGVASLALLALVTPRLAVAQVVQPCEGQFASSVAAVWEPWQEASRVFANGAIRIVRMDTGGEPACCSMHIVVLHPAGIDEPYRSCTLVSATADPLGWAHVDFADTPLGYDPTRGLTVPMNIATFDGGSTVTSILDVTINQNTGEVTVE